MSMTDAMDELSAAWRLAADKLGIAVIAPFAFEKDGRTWTTSAWIGEFGHTAGTVVYSTYANDVLSIRNAAKAVGYYWSELSAPYRRFDRELFIATLDDWGWHNNGAEPPDWYSGQAWS